MRIEKGTRAVVTGGGSGLGRALCHELLGRGARVLVSDRSLQAAEATAAGHADALAYRCDVTVPAEVFALAAEADRAFGGTDLLVNNAGVAVSGRVGNVALDDWKWLFEINVFGVVNGLNAFLPALRKAGKGHVLNVASAAGLTCLPMMGPYNASKAAVVALSETLHGELQGEGVGVTVLCPTFFRTALADTGNARGPEWFQKIVLKLMSRDRLGAEHVARFALDAVEARKLYALPHKDGRMFWRIKRLAPAWYAAQGKRAVETMARRIGVTPEW